ncbi:hypothetical protein, conserved [Trypanosoma brucei gambiense DAL972]|uniref:Uncharacterized protein n=1 Tax=Trypanosoma brucei gambiense (strain MHOM/CI/86/DAL972) TaxID=679716 RepID=D0A865_TRYB9|nr:hypothetical protein, conserved [Trypanosoma brucei gambiense DAL972]CBH17866.1 hypothetical protein, conserved [Trypanosoma brucei gambiense DAL972]|eukprot:XP_011780130.1 hypothetical protein, conserved [Trypanosoma brucei gambiense DAL972]
MDVLFPSCVGIAVQHAPHAGHFFPFTFALPLIVIDPFPSAGSHCMIKRRQHTDVCYYSHDRTGMNRLHPLQLLLAYEETRCPYDLPGEKERRRLVGYPSWTEAALTAWSRQSVKYSVAGEVEKRCEGSKSPVLLMDGGAEQPEPVAKGAVSTPTSGEAEKAIRITEAPLLVRLVAREVVAASRLIDDSATSEDAMGSQVDGVFTSHCKPVRSTESHALENRSANPARELLRVKQPATRDIGVGSDICDPGKGPAEERESSGQTRQSAVEDIMVAQGNQVGDLLSNTVERLYAKLQGTALKVVAIDDLNRQLTEKFESLKPRDHVEDKTELSIYLYSLRRQVENLKREWDVHKTALEASEQRLRGNKTDPSERTVRVQIVKDYETPPVPYKKGPFRPLVIPAVGKEGEKKSSASYSDNSEWTSESSSSVPASSRSVVSSSSYTSTSSQPTPTSSSTDHSSSFSTLNSSPSRRTSSVSFSSEEIDSGSTLS